MYYTDLLYKKVNVGTYYTNQCKRSGRRSHCSRKLTAAAVANTCNNNNNIAQMSRHVIVDIRSVLSCTTNDSARIKHRIDDETTVYKPTNQIDLVDNLNSKYIVFINKYAHIDYLRLSEG